MGELQRILLGPGPNTRASGFPSCLLGVLRPEYSKRTKLEGRPAFPRRKLFIEDMCKHKLEVVSPLYPRRASFLTILSFPFLSHNMDFIDFFFFLTKRCTLPISIRDDVGE